MGIRIVGEEPEAAACFYDSVTGLAFGPVFDDAQDAADFLEEHADSNVLDMSPRAIEAVVAAWLREREEREE